MKRHEVGALWKPTIRKPVYRPVMPYAQPLRKTWIACRPRARPYQDLEVGRHRQRFHVHVVVRRVDDIVACPRTRELNYLLHDNELMP